MLGLIIVILSFLINPSFALNSPVPIWGENGIIVNDTQGNTVQQNSKILKISSSECIIVFEDKRSGHSDLYMQKINSNNDILWDKDGIPLCAAPKDQMLPKIVSDNAGGAFIFWQDERSGNFDIYMQRIDPNGLPQWGLNGLPVSSAPEGQVFPEAIPDGAGGAIITWYDYRFGEEDIFAQRIDSAGSLLWGEEGVPVCREKGTQWFPQLASDRNQGAIVTWADRRRSDFDIYAQRIDYKGEALWKVNGIPVCEMEGNQGSPQIAENGENGAYIAWSDERAKESGAYIQNIKANGQKAFNESGIKLAKEFSSAVSPQIVYDGTGSAVLAWSDPIVGDPDIYMQKIGKNGALLWGEEGFSLIKQRGVQQNPKIYLSGNSFIVLWEEISFYAKEIYMQKIDINAKISFDENILISKDQHSAQDPDLAFLSGENIIVSYEDDKRGNFDIYAQSIGEKGDFLWGEYGKLINGAKGSVAQENFKACVDSKYNMFFVFEDKRSGQARIFAQKVSEKGLPLWGDAAKPASNIFSEGKNPDILYDEKGGIYIAWEDHGDALGSRIFVQHFSPDGKPLFKDGIMITPKAQIMNQKTPVLVSDGAGGMVIVFVDTRGSLDGSDIYAQRIDSKGNLLWGGEGRSVTSGGGNQKDPHVAPKSLIVAWTDYRNGDTNTDIYAQKLSLSGKTLWEEDGIPICEAPDSQRDPDISDDGQNGAVVVWADKGAGSFDIYAQRINRSGQAMWLKDGIPICQIGMSQQRPKIVSISNDNYFIAWEDFRFGNWDIFSQVLAIDGRISSSEEGVSVCQTSHTQYNHDVKKIGKNPIIAWEDYRSGSAYSIYLQLFNPDLKRDFSENGFLVAETKDGARSPKIMPQGSNNFVLAWEDIKFGGCAIAAQKFKL